MQHHFFPGDTGVTVCQYPNGKLANGMQYQVSIAGHTSVTWYTWHRLPDMTPAAWYMTPARTVCIHQTLVSHDYIICHDTCCLT